MRAKTYMVVDPRRDHSFRVPRPDLSTQTESPNACNDCHSGQTPEWAAERIAEWFPEGRQNTFHYAEALHAGRHWAEERAPLLRRVIEDDSQPAIVRATAVSLLAQQTTSADRDRIDRAVDDPEPLVQLAAVEALGNLPGALRYERAQQLLTDAPLALRAAAARSLLAVRGQLGEQRQRDLDAALTEYAAVQSFNSDRGEGLVNAAALAVELGRIDDAERVLLAAIDRAPELSATYANLADLYRTQGREPEAEAVLRQGLAINADDAGLHLALGLSLVRSGRPGEALDELRLAVANAPDSPYYAYVLGVGQNSVGRTEEAIATLTAAHDRFPAHRETLFALTAMLRDAADYDAAIELARRLVALDPADPTARSLLAELEATANR
jgi:Flp pilus assembly protein TadD